MIKLKSLFRRGQGGPSGSSKHSNNNRNKSQSTTSLNSAVDIEQQQQQTTFYPQHNTSERGVDVGDDELNNYHPVIQAPQRTSRSATPDSVQSINTNTLAHKRTKTSSTSSTSATTTPKKAPKQPKLIPHLNVPTAGNVMTTIAVPQNSATTNGPVVVVGGGVNSNSSSITGASSTTTNASTSNNNYNAAAAVAAAAAAATSYQLIQNEQQQQLLEATTLKMQELQKQLDRVHHEKHELELRIGELMPYQSEVAKLKMELSKVQVVHENSQSEISNLKYENESLRSRLRDVVNSPLSDAEKHQIIQDSQRLHSSAPASIALPQLATATTGQSQEHVDNQCLTGGGAGAGVAIATTPSCLTPDWDKHSSSSEISVACLQDKIIQMEETHYSTSEELQATLQELADLQAQLTDAHTENERLAEEKDVLFQSLCRQTEKLNECRNQITTLQELLLHDAKQAEVNTSEREKKLLDLIKTSQDEREQILIKKEELIAELQEVRQSLELINQENTRSRERISILESTINAGNAERKQVDSQYIQAKDEISQQLIEINRLSTLLENARSKIEELEQDLARGEKTDLTDVLDAARKEKDCLEERVAELQDQNSRCQAETRRLKDQLYSVNEECKVAKNNAKCAVSHLEYRLEQMEQEKDKLNIDHQQLLESTAELQVQCKCHLEDKMQLQTLLNETQTHLGDVERNLKDTAERLDKEIGLRKQEAEEWQQFQSDLLMTVRVANDFKTEALSAREQLVMDNKTQKEKIRLLETQIDKLTKQQMQQNETQQSVITTVQQEMASRRNKLIIPTPTTSATISAAAPASIGSILNRQDSRLSVKTLIESIENNSAKSDAENDSNYTSSSNNTTPEITNNILPIVTTNALSSTTANHDSTSSNINDWSSESTRSKGPLREQQQPQTTQNQNQTSTNLVTNIHSYNYNNLNNLSKSLLSGDRKDPLNMLAKNGGSKRNALLKWCQNKTVGYRNIDITNFSSSWNDGLAFCAILHSYLPDRIPYDTLAPVNKRRNFSLAFAAAESVGIPTTLNINDMCQMERPEWKHVMTYITAIYKYFET